MLENHHAEAFLGDTGDFFENNPLAVENHSWDGEAESEVEEISPCCAKELQCASNKGFVVDDVCGDEDAEAFEVRCDEGVGVFVAMYCDGMKLY